jgi:hypothetical protein
MKNYTRVLESENNFCWAVFETATEQVVSRYVFDEDANKHIKFLKSGGGFAGHTPAFMFNNDKKQIKTRF